MTFRIEEKNLELALIKAAGHLGITQSDLAYKIISKSHGFLGFGKKVSIEAWIKNQNTADFTHKIEATDEIPMDLQDDLRRFLAGIYVRMFGHKPEIRVQLGKNGRMIFDLGCDVLANQFKTNTKIAEAFEHLLRKKPRHIRSELPFRIFVDAKGTRLSKEKDLVSMAKDLSNKVF